LPAQVALGAQAKDGERVTVFVTDESGAKYALGSLTKARVLDWQGHMANLVLCALRLAILRPNTSSCALLDQGSCDQFSIGKGLAFAYGAKVRQTGCRLHTV
jgi:hypothetical protein